MDIYLVGGAVRDKLLGFPFQEKDWVVVGATPQELLDQGYQAVGRDFPVFLHPDSREEYALARTERKTGPGYTGFDCYSSPDVSLEDDLKRRDLTINAIAEDSDGNLVDPYGGQRDLVEKKLRHVSAAFSEDPLRVLRAARFLARYYHLGFQVAGETLELMRDIAHSGELSSLPEERVWKELQRALAEKNPEQFFQLLQDCEALAELLPPLAPELQAITPALTAACQLSDNLPVRFACLLGNLDSDTCAALCKKIRAPREYRDLAVLASQFGPLTRADTLDADSQLNILERVDAFRRPERFELFLLAAQALNNNPEICATLRLAREACKAVDIKALAEQFNGKQIASEIHQHRKQAIESLASL